MFLSFSFLSRKNNLFCLSTSCLLQTKLSGCWKEYLYPLSSRFPKTFVCRSGMLLREEHCRTSWFAGGALAGLFSCFVQRWGRKREIASLFLMLQKGSKIVDTPGISLLAQGLWGGRGEERREGEGGKGPLPGFWGTESLRVLTSGRHQNWTHCPTVLWMGHWGLALQMFSTNILKPYRKKQKQYRAALDEEKKKKKLELLSSLVRKKFIHCCKFWGQKYMPLSWAGIIAHYNYTEISYLIVHFSFSIKIPNSTATIGC